MARKTVTDISAWPSLTLEGNLIAPAMVTSIDRRQAPDQTEEDYRIRKGLTIREEISTAFRVGQSHFDAFANVQNPSVEATRRFMRAFLAETFGFDDLVPADGVTSFLAGGRVPIVIVPPLEEKLDRRSPTLSTDRSRSPAFALQDYLNVADDALWGLVTNGTILRLMRDNASLTRPAYIEADLGQIFTNEDAASFAVLWALIHRTRFGIAGAPVIDCALERWREAGSREGEAARENLAGQVTEALKALGSGFLEANPDLAEMVSSGKLDRLDFKNELLRLVYRLIFLMVAEDRNLLHPETAKPEARKLYADGYSLAALRAQAARAAAWDKHHDRYEGTKIVFQALARGEEALGLPALGGLFSADKLPHLETAKLRNRAFMAALYRLSWLSDKTGMVPVNWRVMKTEELGSVYESLLELQPQLGDDGKTLQFASEAAEQRGNQRKTTGSYYTPDSLVQLLLDTTLNPVLDEREAQAVDPAEGLLKLTVIDPACGSGHFLLAAAHRIAERIARIRSGGLPSEEDRRHALREVACRCLYGVDRNPMAVELTKVALWIEALEPGRPLAFFDAQIRCGDSLIGVFDRAMLREGLPDEAYKPLTGDDKELSRRYARLNKEQRDRAKNHLQLFRNWSPPKLLAERDHNLKEIAQDDLASVEAKARGFEAIRLSDDWQNLKTASDLYISANFYMAAFFTPKAGSAASTDAMPLTGHVWQAAGGQAPAEHLRQGASLTSEKVGAFHWFIEFPEIMERDGGFDAVIGNPPWEVSQMSEKEFFAVRAPDIASLSGDERKNAIERLEAENPRLWQEFILAKRAPEAANEFFRSSGRFSRTAIGKLNTYSLFAELFSRLAKPAGRVGVIVPTGIATDSSTSHFFGNLVADKRLAQIIDFENREAIFASVHRSYKFCVLGLGQADKASFAFFLTNTAQLAQSERRFTLTSEEIARINPNTKTAPVFRSRADAELTANLYARTPVLIEERPEEEGGDINPWGITFQQGLFNMTSDSGFFRVPPQMEADGWQRDGMGWVRDTAAGIERRVPLYEAKMIHHFDHRWATYGAGASAGEEGARDCTLAEKQSPDFEPSPRYWVPEEEVILRAARVPSALKGAVRLARGEGGKGRPKANTDAYEGGRSAALKALVIWLAGAIPVVEGRLAREADILRLLGRAQDWRRALKTSPERFLLDPKTYAAGAEMQRETPLTEADLALIAEGPKDALALVELLIAAKQPRWLMGWRDICRATDERTVIASVFPKVGVGHTMPLFFLAGKAELAAAHLAMWLSLTFDFVARLSVGGTHLTYAYLKQFATLLPSSFSKDDLNFIRLRMLELTYTSHAMKPWAEDLGHFGQPFIWNVGRRAQLRAELDVFFARKYGLTKEDLQYVLDPTKVKGADYPSETFRVLKDKETRQFHEYRTERLVLETWRKLSLPHPTTPNIITFPTPSHPAKLTIVPLPTPVHRPLVVPDMPLVADGGWSRPGTNPSGEMREVLLAILHTMSDPLPSERVRRAALLGMEPHLLAPHLEASQAAQWRRVIGPDADCPAPDSGQLDAHWGAAVRHFRARDWMKEPNGNWGPGILPAHIQPGEWAKGRAAIVWDATRRIGETADVIALFSPTLARWRNAEAA